MIKASANIQAEIFVVDNNSSDGSRAYLEKKFPAVHFRWNTGNDGFGKANNSVIKETKGSKVLFLNPDCIVPEDCFEQCLGFFKLKSSCGALGVRMIDGSGKFLRESKRSFPSISASFFKIAGLANAFPDSKLFSKYYAGHLPEHETNETDVLAGAFLMIDKKVLDIIKGFDEDFFMYGEDIDLSFRVQKAGFKNFYFPQTTIIHFKGESTNKTSGSYIQHFYEAMRLFVKKHYKEKKRTLFLMSISIAASKLFAYAGLYTKKIFSKNKFITEATQETLVVAGQVYFNEMIQLIKYAAEPLIIQGRIAIDNNDKDAAIGNIDNIKSIVSKNKTAKVLFCEDPLSFKSMITLMQELRTDFLFHAKKSDSIVGSSDKNKNGVFIAR